jgi:LPS-assembly protein
VTAQTQVSGEEITVDAAKISYDKRQNRISARGDVVVQRGDAELRADQVELDRTTNEALAVGDVSLTGPEGVLHAERMDLDLDDETGSLEKGEISSETYGFSMSGDRIEKKQGQRYRIENGRFTTCRCAEGAPSWSIAGDLLRVNLNGYGTMEGARFNILDHTVLYLPTIKFPVYRERQSGLLLPRVGISNRRGLQIIQPFYWAIDKSQDATLGFDIETAARLGLIGEYRYALNRTTYGNFNISYFNEAIRSTATASTATDSSPNVPENRWGIRSEHSQGIGSGTGYADLQLVGDDLFFREINTYTFDHAEDVALRTLPFTTSRAGFVDQWNRLNLQGEGIYYQDLIDKQSLALQRVPDLSLYGQHQLGYGILGMFNTGMTDFQRSDGITGVREDLHPAAWLRLPLGRSLLGSVRAEFRETAYQLTESDMTGGFRGDDPQAAPIDLPSASTREIFEFGADFSTGFSRIFDFPHFGLDKLKHTIEPRLEYLYVPDIGQGDLPIFDGIDRIDQRDLVTYGIVSRLLARSALAEQKEADRGRVFELARLSLSQSYDFERTIPSSLDSNSADSFSDIDVNLRINPSRYTMVRFVSTYDTGSTAFSSALVGIRLQEPKPEDSDSKQLRLTTSRSFSITYRFINDNQIAPSGREPRDVEQIDSSVVLPVIRRLGFLYATRYDVRRNRFFENYFGLRLVSACDCWSIDLGFSDKSNPNEIDFRAQLTLAGLGSAGSKPGMGLNEHY